MKKRRTLALLALAAVCVCALTPLLAACDNSGGGLTGGGADTLVIYNWEDYIDTGLLDDFADYYREVTGRRLDITYSTFDTNETMLTQVMRGETAVDLVCPSEYAIERLMRAGLLANQSELVAQYSAEYPDAFSNLGNVNQTVLEKIGETFGEMEINGETYDMRDYMVPYMWGTLGLLYNTRIISEEELEEYGWGLLWNESGNPELEDMILMKDSVRDSYAAVVFYMEEYGLLPDGVSETYGKPFTELTANELINCTDSAILQRAEELLTAQRDHISGYEVDFGKDDMINEIVYLDLAWSGDALWAIEESEYYEDTDTYQLGYYVPEKSNIWYDGWAVLESSDSKLAAMMFIDYMAFCAFRRVRRCSTTQASIRRATTRRRRCSMWSICGTPAPKSAPSTTMTASSCFTTNGSKAKVTISTSTARKSKSKTKAPSFPSTWKRTTKAIICSRMGSKTAILSTKSTSSVPTQ